MLNQGIALRDFLRIPQGAKRENPTIEVLPVSFQNSFIVGLVEIYLNLPTKILPWKDVRECPTVDAIIQAVDLSKNH